MSGPEAGLEQKAEAWVEIVTVLQELGLGSPPNISGIDAAITFVRGLAADRDAAQAEIAGIRENCYYECVSKKHAQADIDRVAKDFSDVADHWRAEASRLRSALGSIRVTAREQCQKPGAPVNLALDFIVALDRILNEAAEALDEGATT